MWMRYPTGWSSINVEQQDFGVDYKDSDGNQYVVVPDSIVEKLLVVPGFAVVGRPEGAPDSIKDTTPDAVSDPLAQLSSQVETLRTENQALKDGITEVTKERDDLKAEVAALTQQVARLSPPPPPSETTVGTTGPDIGSGAAPATDATPPPTTTRTTTATSTGSTAPSTSGTRK